MLEADSARMPGGATFLQFLAPGLLAAACMQTAASESSWPVLGRLRWERSYHAMVATPLAVRDLVLGELLWVTARVAGVAVAFAVVSSAFGGMTLRALVPVVVGGVLTGLAFSGPILAYAPTVPVSGNFNVMFRFGITPLFLFSGVFVPVDRLPMPLQVLAWATPLCHGVELVRGSALATLSVPMASLHVTVLLLYLAVGAAIAERAFHRRLLA
jgi:lipooligosaccharide transport system permease protein